MAYRPCVLVAHDLAFVREVVARALADARPGLEVRDIAPDRLDEALGALDPDCLPVVVAGGASTAMQRWAHGWVVLLPDGLPVAFVGAGDAWRTIRRPDIGDLVEAVLERLDRPTAPRPWALGYRRDRDAALA